MNFSRIMKSVQFFVQVLSVFVFVLFLSASPAYAQCDNFAADGSEHRNNGNGCYYVCRGSSWSGPTKCDGGGDGTCQGCANTSAEQQRNAVQQRQREAENKVTEQGGVNSEVTRQVRQTTTEKYGEAVLQSTTPRVNDISSAIGDAPGTFGSECDPNSGSPGGSGAGGSCCVGGVVECNSETTSGCTGGGRVGTLGVCMPKPRCGDGLPSTNECSSPSVCPRDYAKCEEFGLTAQGAVPTANQPPPTEVLQNRQNQIDALTQECLFDPEVMQSGTLDIQCVTRLSTAQERYVQEGGTTDTIAERRRALGAYYSLQFERGQQEALCTTQTTSTNRTDCQRRTRELDAQIATQETNLSESFPATVVREARASGAQYRTATSTYTANRIENSAPTAENIESVNAKCSGYTEQDAFERCLQIEMRIRFGAQINTSNGVITIDESSPFCRTYQSVGSSAEIREERGVANPLCTGEARTQRESQIANQVRGNVRINIAADSLCNSSLGCVCTLTGENLVRNQFCAAPYVPPSSASLGANDSTPVVPDTNTETPVVVEPVEVPVEDEVVAVPQSINTFALIEDDGFTGTPPDTDVEDTLVDGSGAQVIEEASGEPRVTLIEDEGDVVASTPPNTGEARSTFAELRDSADSAGDCGGTMQSPCFNELHSMNICDTGLIYDSRMYTCFSQSDYDEVRARENTRDDTSAESRLCMVKIKDANGCVLSSGERTGELCQRIAQGQYDLIEESAECAPEPEQTVAPFRGVAVIWESARETANNLWQGFLGFAREQNRIEIAELDTEVENLLFDASISRGNIETEIYPDLVSAQEELARRCSWIRQGDPVPEACTTLLPALTEQVGIGANGFARTQLQQGTGFTSTAFAEDSQHVACGTVSHPNSPRTSTYLYCCPDGTNHTFNDQGLVVCVADIPPASTVAPDDFGDTADTATAVQQYQCAQVVLSNGASDVDTMCQQCGGVGQVACDSSGQYTQTNSPPTDAISAPSEQPIAEHWSEFTLYRCDTIPATFSTPARRVCAPYCGGSSGITCPITNLASSPTVPISGIYTRSVTALTNESVDPSIRFELVSEPIPGFSYGQ